MNDLMTFPDTWEEFELNYGFTDVEQIYTNGSRLIQSLRVKQWLDYISAKAGANTDTISRQAAIDIAYPFDDNERHLIDALEELSSAQQYVTATSNTMVSDTVKIPVMDGTTERLPSALHGCHCQSRTREKKNDLR